jgi:hypothetical protein
VFLRLKFKKEFGFDLNLKNPKTLNEKLQWKKIYDRKPIYTICTDKYLVRDLIKEKIGEKYLIPLLFHGCDIDKIDFDKLPIPFIIKPNHGSGCIIIIRDKNDIDKKDILKECNKWLKYNFYFPGREWQYKNIKPMILIEKLILDEKGRIPTDYKFQCFHGKVEFIQIDTDRFGNHKKSFYNSKWECLPFVWCGEKDNKPIFETDKNINKPKNLDEMIKLSEKLASNFDYVRVDLYSLEDKTYFGELTFTPASGFDKFFPREWDRKFGDKLKIKNERM